MTDFKIDTKDTLKGTFAAQLQNVLSEVQDGDTIYLDDPEREAIVWTLLRAQEERKDVMIRTPEKQRAYEALKHEL